MDSNFRLAGLGNQKSIVKCSELMFGIWNPCLEMKRQTKKTKTKKNTQDKNEMIRSWEKKKKKKKKR